MTETEVTEVPCCNSAATLQQVPEDACFAPWVACPVTPCGLAPRAAAPSWAAGLSSDSGLLGLPLACGPR